MSKPTVIPPDNLFEHPAMKGWMTLWPRRVEPECIETLQKRRKSTVYRLKGAGPQGADVIAKRSWLAKVLVERTIYEEVLPQLPIPTLSYYGFVEEENSEYGWFFLEYADEGEYSPQVEEHRVLAARWLGLVHTSAVGIATASRLPDRGPGYYLERLQSAHARILHNLDNPALTVADLAVLKTVVGQCESVASQWGLIEQLCEQLPPTLIHGDFAPKNMRIRIGQAPLALLPFDWGSAGWGSIASDLAQAGMLPNDYWASPDLAVYHSVVQETWPHLKDENVQLLAIFGKIFRCLVCIDLDAESLATPWVEKSMVNMQMYMRDMAEAIQAAEGVG
jgi:hypothetical protein